MTVLTLDTRHVVYEPEEGPAILFEVFETGELDLVGYTNEAGAVVPFPACFRLRPEIEAEVREHVALGLLARAHRVASDAWQLADHERAVNLAALGRALTAAAEAYHA